MRCQKSQNVLASNKNISWNNNSHLHIAILNNYLIDKSNSIRTGNKQVILKAIEDLNLTKEEAISIRDALQENSPAKLEGNERLEAVYYAIITLKNDHRSYFHNGVTESYKVAFVYIDYLACRARVGSIKSTGYGAFFLNKQNYEMHVDKIIQKIKNGHMIREKNKHVFIHSDRLAKIEGNIIEYRNSLRLRELRSFFQIPTALPQKEMNLPPQIIAVIKEIPCLAPELRKDIWNILAEAMIDRDNINPSGTERSSSMILLAQAYIIINDIADGQLVSDYALLQKLYDAVTDYWSKEAWSQVFHNIIKINDSSNATINCSTRDKVAKELRESGISFFSSGY